PVGGRSGEERAAVDRDRLAGHVAVVDEQQHGLRDLFPRSGPPNRNPGRDACLDQRLSHLSVDESGCDGVDCYTLGREPQRVAARQSFQTCLRGCVRDADRAGADAGSDRGDIDDPSPSPRPHARQNGLCAEKGGFQVDGHRAIEILFRDLLEPTNRSHAGVVDQNVDGAEALVDFMHHRLDRAPSRDIGTESGSTATILAYGLGDCLRLRATPAIVYCDRSSGLCQRDRDRLADAARATRDQGHAVFQVMHSRHPGYSSRNTVSARAFSKHRFTVRPTPIVRCTTPAGTVAAWRGPMRMEPPFCISMTIAPSRTTKSSSDVGCTCQRYFPWKTASRRQLSLTRLSTLFRYSSVTALASAARSMTRRGGYLTGSLL